MSNLIRDCLEVWKVCNVHLEGKKTEKSEEFEKLSAAETNGSSIKNECLFC